MEASLLATKQKKKKKERAGSGGQTSRVAEVGGGAGLSFLFSTRQTSDNAYGLHVHTYICLTVCVYIHHAYDYAPLSISLSMYLSTSICISCTHDHLSSARFILRGDLFSKTTRRRNCRRKRTDRCGSSLVERKRKRRAEEGQSAIARCLPPTVFSEEVWPCCLPSSVEAHSTC